jgi:SAM-dependent methyltransferase
MLDLIWILREIRGLGLAPGAKVLDAGAGRGLLQFLLAAEGYEVLSVDFTHERIPFPESLVFKMSMTAKNSSKNEYKEFLKAKKNAGIAKRIGRKLAKLDARILGEARRKKERGRIALFSEDLRDMHFIKEESVDAAVSVSAIEHNPDKEDVRKIACELFRILKRDSVMLITTSALPGKDVFHKPSRGWCFCEDTLSSLFGLSDYETNFDLFESYIKKLKEDTYLKSNLDGFYYSSGDNGMPYGIWDPAYVPIGIRRRKR